MIVDSPPGGGKTRLVTTAISHLETRSDLSLCLATPTRKQAMNLAMRLVEYMPAERIYVGVAGLEPTDLPEGINIKGSKNESTGSTVHVRTIASCGFNPREYDMMIVDEAYQSTFASIASAAAQTERLLLVGDPGQIGPVVTCDVSTWQKRKMAPHRPAPEVMALRDDATVLHMDTTWRLGAATVDAIAPLYGFEFSSGRPDRSLAGHDEIESIVVEPPETPYDPTLMSSVADRVGDLVGSQLSEDSGSRSLEPADVGVVVSHNAQASTIAAMLRAEGLDDVTVGTADRLQGGEWHAVVAVDPLCGHEGVSPHSLSLGRLCVMASRHMTHLTWVHDGRWTDQLGDREVSKLVGKTGRKVRKALCG